MTDEPREQQSQDAGSPRSPSRIDAADDDAIELLVGSFPPVEPDLRVWDNIEAEINATPSKTGFSRSRALPWLLSVAAAAVLLVGAATLLPTSTNSEVVSAYELTDPETGKVTMTVETHEDGTSTVTGHDLPDLPVTQTYQLWSVVNDEVVSVGVLGNELTSHVLRIEGEPVVLALSIETRGGVAVSEQDPTAVWIRS
jgi:hypothetical protein